MTVVPLSVPHPHPHPHPPRSRSRSAARAHIRPFLHQAVLKWVFSCLSGTWGSLVSFLSAYVASLIFVIVTVCGMLVDVWGHCQIHGFSLRGLWTRMYGGWHDPPFKSVADFVEQSNHDTLAAHKLHLIETVVDDVNNQSSIHDHVHAHAQLSLSSVQVMTDDGYHLTLHHITSSSPATKGPVFLQHGLIQTCLPFLVEKNQSLAIYLARRGYDVWLGNNRGSLHSRSHATLSPSQPEFWHYSIDELALDVRANVTYIRHVTGQRVAYIGHSQGCSQALAALSTNEEVREAMDVFIALAPGAFVRCFSTQSLCMRFLSRLYRTSRRLFFFCFGLGSFAPSLETLRTVGISRGLMPIVGYGAFCVFKVALQWGDDMWNKPRKNLYFHETPGGTSTRVIAHWIQQSLSSSFARYDYGSSMNMTRYGSTTPPAYPLHQINTPTLVIYGGKDHLLDFPRLIQELGPHCKLSKCIPHHQHLDSLVAEDAHQVMYPDIVSFIESQRA